MLDQERASLLDRCLRLEHALCEARGLPVAPLLPKTLRRSLHDGAPRVTKKPLRRTQRESTADERVRMRELRQQGRTIAHIAGVMGFGASTVSVHTRDVLREREVGER